LARFSRESAAKLVARAVSLVFVLATLRGLSMEPLTGQLLVS
jgi:hypothetical protein